VGSLEGETFTLYAQVITGLGAPAEGDTGTPAPPTGVPTGNSPVSDSALPVAWFAAAAAVIGGVAVAGRQLARSRS